MIIRCWGARGSIPVSGKQYIKYGGDTTCLEIRTIDDNVLIVDSGTGIRRLGNRLIQENRHSLHLLFTHSHWDHLMGFPFFKPIYMEESSITLYGCPFHYSSIREYVSNVMTSPHCPAEYGSLRSSISYQELCSGGFSIGAVTVFPIMLSHPNNGVGYKFIEGNKSFVFLTDNELGYTHPGGMKYSDYCDISSGADLLFHDAEFTCEEYEKTKSWGHSVYTEALNLALDAGVKQFGLFHHNQDRTDEEIDGMVDACRRIVGEQKSSLECFALSQDMEIVL